MKSNWNLFIFLEDMYDEMRFRLRKSKTAGDRIRAVLPVTFTVIISVILLIVLLLGLSKLISFGGRIIQSSGPAASTSQQESVRESESDIEPAADSGKIYQEKDITLGATGCMLLHSPFISSYPDAEGNYDFSSIYRFITPYYSEPDFMTCEFEGALGGPELGYHGHPLFRSPDIIIENIRDSGVDLQMLATNHIYDAGTDGFHRTMSVYEEKGIACTGIRENTSQKPYYIADIDGVCVGFLDYVYETEGPGVYLNGLPLTQEDGELVNSFEYDNLEAFYQEVSTYIRNMRQDGARFIVLNLHWGIEYQLTESETQRQMAQRLCDLGVDALIGGHTHCEQPIDVFENQNGDHTMFCIFSVGNALSNQRTYLMTEMPTGHTEDGVLLTLSLHQSTDGTVAISDVDLLPTWVYRFSDNGSKYYILPLDNVEGIEELTGIAGIQAEAQASYDRTMAELGPGLEKARAAFRDKNK